MPLNMFKSSINFFPDSSKAVLRLWIFSIIIIYASYLSLLCYLVCSLWPCDHLLGKGWTLGSLTCCVSCVLSLFHVVFWVRCGT